MVQEESSVDSQAVKRRLGGWCEMAASQPERRNVVGRESPFRKDFSTEAE
jgi:hypothetical protein